MPLTPVKIESYNQLIVNKLKTFYPSDHMNICIAYDSKYGNGKKCCEYLQQYMAKKGHISQMFYIRDIEPEKLPLADLYIFSVPTHIGGPTMKMKGFLKKLNVPKGKNYSLISTCVEPNTTQTLDKMSAIIEPHGLNKISEGIKVKVDGMKGPLWSGYQKQLEMFADKIISSK